MEIGSKLKNARNEKGITQEDAAELLGVSRQTISNWETGKSYPDIISVIKMSDIYFVSLDHLLKEDKTMKQTYQEFLEESTNTVKAKKNLGKVILLSTYFIIWALAVLIIWQLCSPMAEAVNIAFKWVLLPALLLLFTVVVAKNDYWGKANWFCVLGAAITFATVPYTSYVQEGDMITYTFRFPDFAYMLVGVVLSVCGILVGGLLRKKN